MAQHHYMDPGIDSHALHQHALTAFPPCPTLCNSQSLLASGKIYVLLQKTISIGLVILQEAIKACWLNAGDLKEVHFVLFGSDTHDVWLAQANKHLKPVADTEKSSHASPAKDEASPMDAAPTEEAGKHDSPAAEGSAEALVTKHDSSPSPSTSDSPPEKDEPSAMIGTGESQHASETGEAASKTAQGQEDATQGQSVQTLTGVKEGEASEASQEALGAPEVLEAAPPANYANLSGHSASTSLDAPQKKTGADAGKVKATSHS